MEWGRLDENYRARKWGTLGFMFAMNIIILTLFLMFAAFTENIDTDAGDTEDASLLHHSALPCYGAYSDVSGMAIYVVVDGVESGGLFLIRLTGMGSNIAIENLGFGMRVCTSVELSDEWRSELAERGVNVNTQAIDVFRPFGERDGE